MNVPNEKMIIETESDRAKLFKISLLEKIILKSFDRERMQQTFRCIDSKIGQKLAILLLEFKVGRWRLSIYIGVFVENRFETILLLIASSLKMTLHKCLFVVKVLFRYKKFTENSFNYLFSQKYYVSEIYTDFSLARSIRNFRNSPNPPSCSQYAVRIPPMSGLSVYTFTPSIVYLQIKRMKTNERWVLSVIWNHS